MLRFDKAALAAVICARHGVARRLSERDYQADAKHPIAKARGNERPLAAAALWRPPNKNRSAACPPRPSPRREGPSSRGD